MTCTLCPRMCGARRTPDSLGMCGQEWTIRIARADLHPFEEPCISGTAGSGTVFFCGCPLHCVYCQNGTISGTSAEGTLLSPAELGTVFLHLQERGAHNINLVTPTHFALGIAHALKSVKDRLTIPVVYNTSGYERVSTLHMLEGLVDIYMPDFKYISPTLSEKYSAAPDYGEVAVAAIAEMFRQVGEYVLDESGLLQKGVLVRHLILPSCRKDSMAVLDRLADLVPPHKILFSLMRQYTPEFAAASPYEELHRRLTSFEYESVLTHAHKLGFVGYRQGKTSASVAYTPEF